MQKVLLASTALVMTTGWAMADVTNDGDGLGASITLEGEAFMGVVGSTQDGSAGLQFFTDADLAFKMVGQTQGGLEFGATVDLDEQAGYDDSITGDGQQGETLYIKGAFGTLTMGDTDGAFDWAMQETDIGASLDSHAEEHTGFGNGNSGLDGFYDGQIARYDYTFAGTGFSVALSAELDDNEYFDGFDSDGDIEWESPGGPILGLGAKYETSGSGIDMTFGAAIQSVSDFANTDFDMHVWGLSADLGFGGGFRTVLNYAGADFDDDFTGDHYGIGVGYETGPWLIAANYGHWDDWFNSSGARLDGDGYGLQANYDLGGGAKLLAGVAQNNPQFGDDFTTYSFGVSMDF